jgi:hypothetical protein
VRLAQNDATQEPVAADLVHGLFRRSHLAGLSKTDDRTTMTRSPRDVLAVMSPMRVSTCPNVVSRASRR